MKQAPVLNDREKQRMLQHLQRTSYGARNRCMLQLSWLAGKGEDGEKRLVERQKRVKRWWYVDPMGNCYLTINYGSRRLELDKGKSTIAVGGKDNLVATIDAVIAAVEAGELDAAISATQRTGQKPRAKAA